MTLRTKTLLFTALAMIGLIATLYLGTAKVLLGSFERLENFSLNRQMGHVKYAFDEDLNALRHLVRQDSAWTAMYTFVETRNLAFAQSELTRANRDNVDLDFLAVVNARGAVVFSQASGKLSRERKRLRAAVQPYLQPGSPLLRHKTVHDVHGELVSLPSGPLFIASAPLVTSRLQGPIRGSLVMARPFTAENAPALRAMGLSFELYPLDASVTPEIGAVIASLQAQQDDAILERHQDTTSTTGYTLLRDEAGRASFLLEMTAPRRIYAQALRSRATLLLVVSLVCAAFVALSSYFLHRAILSRLQLLSQGLQGVAHEGSATRRLEISGRDEFAKLAADANQMLDALGAAQGEAQANAERYALVAEGVNDGVWNIDATGEMECSPRLWQMLGYDEENRSESLARPQVREHIHPDDLPRVDLSFQNYLERKTTQLEVEFRVRPLDGPYRWMLLRGAAYHDGTGRVAGSLTDLTRRGLFDALTGLPNRLLLHEHLEHALTKVGQDPDTWGALLFMDVDRFKLINDSLGHYFGDLLLTEVAKRLQATLRPTDTVARLGGDEFVVLLEGLNSVADLEGTVQRLITEISSPFFLEGQAVSTSLSIGVVADLRPYASADNVLRDADNAMYYAKDMKMPVAYFDGAMLEQAKERLQLEADLRQALQNGEFSLVYQPIVSLRDGKMIGVETLLRWQHPVRGAVSPGVFIPIAEETRLIVALGEWVLEEACRQISRLSGTFSVSVNLSGQQFNDELVESVTRILRETGLPPQRLILEVTESAVMENSSLAAGILARLRALGVRTALDDFGTGYSSLSYLSTLPLDLLKIDHTFVDRLLTDSKSRAVVQTIVSLSQALALSVVAEGVETEAHVDLLRVLECHYAQGYHFFRPLPLAALRELTDRAPESEALSPSFRNLN